MTGAEPGRPERIAIVIPSRYGSSRFPGKPLVALLAGDEESRPLIEWTWRLARSIIGIAQVVVATDDERIAAIVDRCGGTAMMTPQSAENGTERCAMVLERLDQPVDLVVNLQGDAPLTPRPVIERLMAAFDDPDCRVVTPAIRAAAPLRNRLYGDQAAGRIGGTTVVTDAAGNALYFSKSIVPHMPTAARDEPPVPLLFHLGVYAYRPEALALYAALPPGRLERVEGLEQLRFLENNIAVHVVECEDGGEDLWELNNPEDVPMVEAGLRDRAAR